MTTDTTLVVPSSPTKTYSISVGTGGGGGVLSSIPNENGWDDAVPYNHITTLSPIPPTSPLVGGPVCVLPEFTTNLPYV